MRKCIVPEAFLLYSLPTGGIRGISLDTARGDATIPFESKVDANLLDFSAEDSMIYWTNYDMVRNKECYLLFVTLGIDYCMMELW